MVAHGRVQNGVVVLTDGVRFPDGQEVTVFALPPKDRRTHSIMDIQTVNLGGVLRAITADDDLLEEMLEVRS